MTTGFTRIPAATLENTFYDILIRHDMKESRARQCAQIFTANSLAGVYTHGVNRFPRFIQYVRDGYVHLNREPRRTGGFGCIEQWNGNLGPGVLNALQSTERAMQLATQHGLGCVALSNTNHWMRGGYYGWHAALSGYVFIGWTNTLANMPAWGAIDGKLGNNPLVIASPIANNDAIVVDTAMSQYSYGVLDLYKSKGEMLPVPGGYDADGNLTQDPAAILDSKRVLSIGYWKGTGLSLILDVLATILSGGQATHEISKRPAEYGLSQVFIAMDPLKIRNQREMEEAIMAIIKDYHEATPETPGKSVRYPGERQHKTVEENTRLGIPVAESVWQEILALKEA
jgi:3-dehydro-L-gulonate 2-dehydrogenase